MKKFIGAVILAAIVGVFGWISFAGAGHGLSQLADQCY